MTDDEIRQTIGRPAQAQRERGTDLTIFSPRAAAWVTILATRRSASLGRRLQRADLPCLLAVPEELRRRGDAAAERPRLAGSPRSTGASTNTASSGLT
jgi:hypothetical protein